MEDEYELISKDFIKNLKEENNKLKKQLTNSQEEKQTPQIDTKELINHLIETFHEESGKERELILENLNEIKELNKSTLDNLLTKTQSLDTRLESMISNLKVLVESISLVIEEMPKEDNTKKILEEIKNVPSQNENELKYLNIENKLKEIEIFLDNLKILLAQIKPNDMIIRKL